MKRAGDARRDVLVRLARQGPEPRVDVGADHGRVARALGCVATERRLHRIADRRGRWVVCDGLRAFGPLGTAVIAGMGWRTIARILTDAPPLKRAVLHAQDDPPSLRLWLAAHGWRIVDEGLAPEARRYAEIIAVEPGDERASGERLALGPVLLQGRDAHAEAHFRQLRGYYAGLVEQTAGHASAHARFSARLACIDAWLDGR